MVHLEIAASKFIANKTLDPHLVEEAKDMLLSYYSTYPLKKSVHTAIANYVQSFEQNLVLSLLKFYRKSGYKTKGAPDLFATKNGSFLFIEVKSHTDSLSSAQYEFFEGYLTSVSNNIFIFSFR